ncbi:hypothetical protein Tco_1033192 [Tanacetum coccineum]|uniref:Uncharacterized protein n=1 Tax=Tanacetum coccineum TaxID=301880 RepID=A0ABQ5GE11_9ASTR
MLWLSFSCSNSGSMRCGKSGLNKKTCKKNDVKARSLLLMALPNEHQLTFDQYVDAQSMFAAIKARFGGNEATKKTQKALLKQLLPSEWDTHVVVWMNKPDFDTMGLDDLYNNFKIVEQKVKKSVGASNDDKNLAFVCYSGASLVLILFISVNPASSTATTKVNTASTEISTASFSDATVYAFFHFNKRVSTRFMEVIEQLMMMMIWRNGFKVRYMVEYFNYINGTILLGNAGAPRSKRQQKLIQGAQQRLATWLLMAFSDLRTIRIGLSRSKQATGKDFSNPLIVDRSHHHSSLSSEPSTEPTFEPQPSPDAEYHVPSLLESPLHAVHSHGSDEGSLKLIELMNLVTKLSERIGVLEDDLKRTKQTYKDEEDDSSKQGRKISDIDEDLNTYFAQDDEVVHDQDTAKEGQPEDKPEKKSKKLLEQERLGLEEAIRFQNKLIKRKELNEQEMKSIARQLLALDEEKSYI